MFFRIFQDRLGLAAIGDIPGEKKFPVVQAKKTGRDLDRDDIPLFFPRSSNGRALAAPSGRQI